MRWLFISEVSQRSASVSFGDAPDLTAHRAYCARSRSKVHDSRAALFTGSARFPRFIPKNRAAAPVSAPGVRREKVEPFSRRF